MSTNESGPRTHRHAGSLGILALLALVGLLVAPFAWDHLVHSARGVSGAHTVLAAAVAAIVGAVWRVRRRSDSADALRARAMREQLALQVGRMGWWHWIPGTSTLHWSDEMGPLYGHPAGWQAADGHALGCVHPDDRERVVREFAAGMAAGSGRVAPWRVVWPCGEVRWLEGDLRVEAGDARTPRSVTGVVREVTDLMRATEAAQRAESYLRTMLQCMGDGVIVREADSFAATLTNAAAAEMLGVPQSELSLPFAGNSRWALYDDLGRPVEQARTAGQRALDTGMVQSAFYHVKRPDGHWRWIQVRAVPFDAGAGHDRAVLLTLSDLSAVRSLQRRLEEQTVELRAQNEELALQNDRKFVAESRFRGVLTAMHDGVLLHSPDGTLILSNPAAKRILGIDSLHGQSLLQADGSFPAIRVDGTPLPPEQHPTRLALLRQQTTRQVVLGVHRPDGSLIWLQLSATSVETSGKPTVIVTTFSDITALRRTEMELAEREAHYRLIATGTRDMVSMTDLAGTLEWVSPSSRTLLGWDANDLVGTSLQALQHPDDATTPAGFGNEVTGTRQQRLRRADGTYLWAETSFTAVPDVDGSIGGHLCVTRDVSERREMTLRLSQSERLRAVGTLAGGLAHDFNNVLAVVRVTAEGLLDDTADTRVQEELRTILYATDRAQSLTRQMLTFARRQVSLPVVSELDVIMEGALPLFRHLIRPPLGLQQALGAPRACVRIDPDELITAVMNVLSNAADAMPSGGTVSLRTEVVALEVPNAMDLTPGRYVRVVVQDTGEGMSDDVRSRALEPFFTTKPVGKGTGLGLATVFGVVKNAGGSVSIESTVGVGTVIGLWLPLVPGPVTTPEAPAAERTPASEQPMRVLIADDEVALRRLIGRAARARGHEVHEVESVNDALAVLEREGHRIDALITDHLMPGQTGRSLIEQVQQRWPHIRCALTSGYTDDEQTISWLERGSVPFLRKPFTLQALEELLGQLSGGHAAQQALTLEPSAIP